MAAPEQLGQFLQRAWDRFPQGATTVTRKYALVLWDHGNGWKVRKGGQYGMCNAKKTECEGQGFYEESGMLAGEQEQPRILTF